MVRNISAEAKQLEKRFDAIANRAEFARDFKVPGGQAMIYQHIKALKPISLKAAKAYMQGFKCQLHDISPYLAEEFRDSSKPSWHVEERKIPYATDNPHIREVIQMMEEADNDIERAKCVGAVALVLGRKPPNAKKQTQRTGT